MPQNSWGNTPAVLQFSITPYANINRGALISNNYTSYLYPSNATISGAFSPGIGSSNANGPILSGGCSGTGMYQCSVTITGLDNAGGGPNTYSGPYIIHLVNYYDSSNISITGFNSGSPSTPLSFINGQAQIDATGQAQNVRTRLQVRKPLIPTLELPNYSLESQNACKRFATDPVNGTNFIATQDNTTHASAGLDPSCVLSP